MTTIRSAMPPPNSSQSIGLAIEVIGREGSIALMKGDEIQIAKSLDVESRAASALIPAIRELLGGDLSRIVPEFIGVAIGPGSFTGLRIAVTVAKTLAFGWKIPLVEVDSLTAIAKLAQVSNSQKPGQRPIFVGLSAYRGQVFRGRFTAAFDAFSSSEPAIALLSQSDWQCELKSIIDQGDARSRDENRPSRDENWLLSGDRAAFGHAKIEIPDRDWVTPMHPRAVGIGLVAAEKFRAGQTVSPMTVVPNYFRPSAAEEKENHGSSGNENSGNPAGSIPI